MNITQSNNCIGWGSEMSYGNRTWGGEMSCTAERDKQNCIYFVVPNIHQQTNCNECGLYAIANIVEFLH